MAERAADGAAVAGLAVSDLQQRLVHDRPMRAHDLGVLELALAGHGANLEAVRRLADIGEPIDAVEVDNVVGEHETHVEHGHQRLPAGEELGVLKPGEQPDGVRNGSWIVVAERRRLHGGPRERATSLHIPSVMHQSKELGNPDLRPSALRSQRQQT